MGKTTQETWQQRSFPSGTQIVTTGEPDKPHLYVYGPRPTGEGEDAEAECDRNRWRMCKDLTLWLNGDAPRPAWMEDLTRVSEARLTAADGSDIRATGPSYDADPPNLDWRERDDDEAKDARARLIDRLMTP